MCDIILDVCAMSVCVAGRAVDLGGGFGSATELDPPYQAPVVPFPRAAGSGTSLQAGLTIVLSRYNVKAHTLNMARNASPRDE
jgi:hypothetical protein